MQEVAFRQARVKIIYVVTIVEGDPSSLFVLEFQAGDEPLDFVDHEAVASLVDIAKRVANKRTVIDGIASVQLNRPRFVGFLASVEKKETGRQDPKCLFHWKWFCLQK